MAKTNDRLETIGWEFPGPRVQITTKTISVAAAAAAAEASADATATLAADCQDKVCLLKACVRKD